MECESSLTQVDQSGLYALKSRERALAPTLFIFTGEVDAEFKIQDQPKRIHLLILCPNLEVAKQVTNIASKYGDLSSDGRPKLHVAPPELVEAIMEIDPWNEVIPAHIWTVWLGWAFCWLVFAFWHFGQFFCLLEMCAYWLDI